MAVVLQILLVLKELVPFLALFISIVLPLYLYKLKDKNTQIKEILIIKDELENILANTETNIELKVNTKIERLDNLLSKIKKKKHRDIIDAEFSII